MPEDFKAQLIEALQELVKDGVIYINIETKTDYMGDEVRFDLYIDGESFYQGNYFNPKKGY